MAEFQDLNTVKKYFLCLSHLPHHFTCCVPFLVQWEIAFITGLTNHPPFFFSIPFISSSITSSASQKVVIRCLFTDSHSIPCNTLSALLCITSSSVFLLKRVQYHRCGSTTVFPSDTVMIIFCFILNRFPSNAQNSICLRFTSAKQQPGPMDWTPVGSWNTLSGLASSEGRAVTALHGSSVMQMQAW